MNQKALSRAGKVGIVIIMIIVAAIGAYAFSGLTSKSSTAIVTKLPKTATGSSVASGQLSLKGVRSLYPISPSAILG